MRNDHDYAIEISSVTVVYTDETREAMGSETLAANGTTVFAATESTSKTIARIEVGDVTKL